MDLESTLTIRRVSLDSLELGPATPTHDEKNLAAIADSRCASGRQRGERAATVGLGGGKPRA
jgi:hypothetical protein